MSQEIPIAKAPEAPGIIAERSEAETARLREEAEDADPRDTSQRYADELGIAAEAEGAVGRQLTDAEKRERDALMLMPHESRRSSEADENLARLTEENTAAVAGARWARQEELGEAHEAERRGRILHAHEFVKKLWQCGIVCVLTRCNVAGLRSLRGDAATRELRARYDRCMAGLVINSSCAMPLPAPRYATWIQIPAMYEFSVMRFDTHGLPTREKYRGWRTVLLELIRQGFLTEADANRVFGEATGPAARRWLEILQGIRNERGVC